MKEAGEFWWTSRHALHQSDHAKKSHGKGTNIQTNDNTRTSRLRDQLGPEGRVGENTDLIVTPKGG